MLLELEHFQHQQKKKRNIYKKKAKRENNDISIGINFPHDQNI